MQIMPFYIVCGFNNDFSLWIPLKCFVDKHYAIRYCKKNCYIARYPWQKVFSIFNMEFENAYYDQEGYHDNK